MIWVCRAFVFTGGGGFALAQPKPDPILPQEVENRDATALSGVKKDLESVKSLRELGLGTKSESLKVALPSMPNGLSPAPATVPKIQGRAPIGKARPNWLVDAMEKPVAGKAARGDEIRLMESPVNSRSGGKEGKVLANEPGEQSAHRGSAVNPFNQYLQGWMSPHDLAMLKPALDSPRLSSGASEEPLIGQFAPGASVVSADFARSAGSTGGGGAVPSATARPNGLRTNPYLENLIGGITPAPNAGSTTKPSLFANKATAPAELGLPDAPPPMPPQKIPDFVRPQTDEKYYKPIKRF